MYMYVQLKLLAAGNSCVAFLSCGSMCNKIKYVRAATALQEPAILLQYYFILLQWNQSYNKINAAIK